jgi:hypothetical protein
MARNHFIRARRHYCAGEFDEAEDYYRRSIDIDDLEAEPLLELAMLLYDKIESTESDTRTRLAEQGLTTSSRLLRISNYGQVKILFEAVVHGDMPTRTVDTDSMAYWYLSDIAFWTVGFRAQMFFLNAAVKCNPDHWSKLTLMMYKKCRPWLFLPDDGSDGRPALFNPTVVLRELQTEDGIDVDDDEPLPSHLYLRLRS